MPILGEFEQLVLVAVVRLRDGAYGVPIQREVEERAGRRVTVGALYATLDRLEGKRLLESWFADPTPQRGGKSKRYFRLTAAGEAALTEAKSAHDRIWRGVRLKGGFRA
jgi:PadR family transcriptional regulator, regulatory protein PadR